MNIVAAAGVALALLGAACTPQRSRMEPYRHDSRAAAVLAGEARDQCARRRGDAGVPPNPFTTDGCSLAPDGPWASCCVEHDATYWCGGSAAERRRADRRLASCAREHGASAFDAAMAVAATRVGGVPWSGLPWRWGYGWDGLRGYDEESSGAARGLRGQDDPSTDADRDEAAASSREAIDGASRPATGSPPAQPVSPRAASVAGSGPATPPQGATPWK